MGSFKPIDGAKEDFRKYLDRKGVLDAITKVLVKCNSDRPENAIEFLLENMGDKLKEKDTIARLENDLNDARNEIELLKREIYTLKGLKTEETEVPTAVVEVEAVKEETSEKMATNEAAIKEDAPKNVEAIVEAPQSEPDSSTTDSPNPSEPKEKESPE